MPLKPERAYPSLDNERRRIAERTAGIIERHIFQVAHDLYGNNFEFERFTEIAWNGYAKKSFLKSLTGKGKTSLFHIEIANPLPEGYVREVTEVCLYVEFMRATIEWGSDFDETSIEKITRCCKNISSDTGLVVALRWKNGFLRYIRP